NENRLYFLIDAQAAENTLQIAKIIEPFFVELNKNITQKNAGVVRRAACFNVHGQQTSRCGYAARFLQGFGDRHRLHYDTDVRSFKMSFFTKVLSDASQCGRWYCNWPSASDAACRHSEDLTVSSDQCSAGKTCIQRQIGPNKLIDSRTSELPFTHEAAENSGTCYQIASACSTDCNNNFT